VGVIDDHVAYAAPTSNGGFCLYFAPDPRSGPTGTSCIPRGAHPGEVVFSVLHGTDGGLLFGRVGDEDAATVDITFPDDAGTLTTPVADSGFFGLAIPDGAMRTMMIATQPGPKDPATKDGGPIMGFVPERVAAISVAACDAKGTQIASGVPVTLAEAETGTGPGASPTRSR
jgi:hypothetical protein